VKVDAASVFTCLRIALRTNPENGPTSELFVISRELSSRIVRTDDAPLCH
jgi:hypothetical protein